jgi:hypothetical protein
MVVDCSAGETEGGDGGRTFADLLERGEHGLPLRLAQPLRGARAEQQQPR